MPNEANVTIILLIRGRPWFTERWLKYANQNLKNFCIIIADGSNELEKFKVDESSFSNINIRQITFPFDKDIETYQAKIIKSLNAVSTQYVCMMSNDDFIFQNSILNQIKFLDNNPEYSASRGDVFDFAINSLDKKNQLYGDIYSVHRLFHPIGFNKNSALDRLKDFEKCPNGLWHSVIRTEILKEIINKSIQEGITTHQIFEFYVTLSLIASGKIYFDKSLYLLHQIHKNMQTDDDNFLTFDDEIKIHTKIYNKFIDSIATIINEKEKNSIDVRKYIIELTTDIKRKPIHVKHQSILVGKIKTKLVLILSQYKFLNYIMIKLKNYVFKNDSEYHDEISIVNKFLSK